MIFEYNIKRFCCEDISLIENYEQAIADESQVWHCHHRKETDEGLSKKQLKEMGLYFNRPANELIFFTPSEHRSLHHKGKKNPKVSAALKGRKTSAEHRAKLSAAMKGKKWSAESRAKLSASNKGKPLTKYKWLTPDEEIKIMDAANVTRFHPDWVRIEPVGE